MRVPPFAGLLAGLFLVAVLPGCAPYGAGRCIDYIPLPTPAERYEAAELVVEADVSATDRTVTDFAVYPEYRAEVVEVLKGAVGGSTLRVLSTSDQCEVQGQEAQYVEGDTLASGGRRVLYLVPSDVEGVWRLVVPGAADPAGAADRLPG